jgi:hypothetical protein
MRTAAVLRVLLVTALLVPAAAFPTTCPFWNPPVGDCDGDGVGDAADNCPLHPNAGQEDGDGDGVGDAYVVGGLLGAAIDFGVVAADRVKVRARGEGSTCTAGARLAALCAPLLRLQLVEVAGTLAALRSSGTAVSFGTRPGCPSPGSSATWPSRAASDSSSTRAAAGCCMRGRSGSGA